MFHEVTLLNEVVIISGYLNCFNDIMILIVVVKGRLYLFQKILEVPI